MGVDFGKTFSRALEYGFDLNKLLPFFLMNLSIVAIALIFINNLSDIVSILMAGSNATAALNLVTGILVIILIMLVIGLVRIFFQAVVTDNARLYWQKKNVKLSKSYSIAKKKYVTIIFALLLSGIISGFVSTVLVFAGTIGAFLSMISSFILAFIFLFLIQIIVISNKGVVDSIREGYRLFSKNILDVFIFWLILMILSFIIICIALIPLLISIIPVVAPLIESASSSSIVDASVIGEIMVLIKANMLGFAIAGAISALIVSYMQVFKESALTFFYLQKKKR